MRISDGYSDRFIGCILRPDDSHPDEFGFSFDAFHGPADPPSIEDIGSGLDAPGPELDPTRPRSIEDIGSGLDTPEPTLDPNNPADLLRIRSGL